MEEITERPERQLVLHGVLDNGPFFSIVKPVGVPPEPVGTTHLLVYESGRWHPFRDTRPPAQRDREQAEPVIDQGSFLHRDRLRREDPEAQFRRRDTLQIGRVSEEDEHRLARKRQAHGCLEDVRGHASYCSGRCCSAYGRLVSPTLRNLPTSIFQDCVSWPQRSVYKGTWNRVQLATQGYGRVPSGL